MTKKKATKEATKEVKPKESYLEKRKANIQASFNEVIEQLKENEVTKDKLVKQATVLQGAYAELKNQEKENEK